MLFLAVCSCTTAGGRPPATAATPLPSAARDCGLTPAAVASALTPVAPFWRRPPVYGFFPYTAASPLAATTPPFRSHPLLAETSSPWSPRPPSLATTPFFGGHAFLAVTPPPCSSDGSPAAATLPRGR